MITLGSKAPEFTLKDQLDKTVNLKKFKGKKVVLSFRPLAWTPVCHDQMLSLERNITNFEKNNAVAFGLGVDSAPSNRAWALTMGLKKTRLLSDFWPHGEIAKAYDVFRESDGFSERANIVIDEAQKVVFAKIYPTDQLPDINEVISFLEQK